jgi:hypothetical protein
MTEMTRQEAFENARRMANNASSAASTAMPGRAEGYAVAGHLWLDLAARLPEEIPSVVGPEGVSRDVTITVDAYEVMAALLARAIGSSDSGRLEISQQHVNAFAEKSLVFSKHDETGGWTVTTA